MEIPVKPLPFQHRSQLYYTSADPVRSIQNVEHTMIDIINPVEAKGLQDITITSEEIRALPTTVMPEPQTQTNQIPSCQKSLLSDAYCVHYQEY